MGVGDAGLDHAGINVGALNRLHKVGHKGSAAGALKRLPARLNFFAQGRPGHLLKGAGAVELLAGKATGCRGMPAWGKPKLSLKRFDDDGAASAKGIQETQGL